MISWNVDCKGSDYTVTMEFIFHGVTFSCNKFQSSVLPVNTALVAQKSV